MGEYDGPSVPEFFADEVHSGEAVDFGCEECPCPLCFCHGFVMCLGAMRSRWLW